MNKKLFAIVSLLTITAPTFAYDEIKCSVDPVFAKYSCNQCFDGGSKVQGDNLGLLNDVWMNVTDVKKILFKEEQRDPYMLNLKDTDVSWKQIPDANKFWEYTDDFNKLYSDADLGYVLDAGKSVTWIKSNLSHAYNLEKNTATTGENIGLLVYPITSHNILANGEVSMDNSEEHLECVLFKSGAPAKKEVPTPAKETPKQLPKTGPSEFILLLILSMFIGVGVLKFKTKS